jgi:enoyl-CoA hydratase/carnithine racemase
MVYAPRKMRPSIETAQRDGVATVTVDNPPVNALSDAVLAQLRDAAAALGADPGVRAVVLAGAGERTFIAGADLASLAHALGDAAAMHAHVELTAAVFAAWEALEVPVVAAIGGHAMGGGLELALVCDLLVVDPRAKLGTPEIGLGLIPGAGATQRLPRRVGQAQATRMVLLGRAMTAQAALEAGLVDAISEPGASLAEAQALAARLAALPARAVRAAKAALRAAARQPLDDGLRTERDLFLGVAATADAREGANAFLEKRVPEFAHA